MEGAARAGPRAALSAAGDLGELLPAWSALPFAGMLLSIALLPLAAPVFWHRRFPAVTAAWMALTAIPFVAAFGASAMHELAHVAVADYLPFIVLLAALFTIGGGIHVRGSLRATPWANAGLLAIGTALASWVGTTGAAILMIRPLLRANRARRHKAHTVVFFIFLVANIGGALTPLGDPPLFLGFLHGVPFFWTFGLWPEVLLVACLVLGVYLLHDLHYWRREAAHVREAPPGPREAIRIEGWQNFLFLGGVLAAVILSGTCRLGEVRVLGVTQRIENLLRDGALLLMLAGSWLTTPARVRAANEYSWAPIREVAILFGGIFATMIPALAMLRAGDRGALALVIRAVRDPAHFFWASGILSSFLDNAPTYLTFLSTALGRLYPGAPEAAAVPRLLAEHHAYLRAIATGSVFMGANTYIGNAPNFMVKAIAEEAGVPMPSFFGYVLRYSVPVLVPVFGIVTWAFFAGPAG
ncbi:MAG TPA: sodium:proton antiporter [Candidatus Binatia bacterium]|nr:sodium:proton antiporter [Candidatus Binatia bacterium]